MSTPVTLTFESPIQLQAITLRVSKDFVAGISQKNGYLPDLVVKTFENNELTSLKEFFVDDIEITRVLASPFAHFSWFLMEYPPLNGSRTTSIELS